MVRPGKLRTQPFVLMRLLPRPGTYRMVVTINLVEAIKAKHRTIERTFDVAAPATAHDHSSSGDGGPQRSKRQKLITTQAKKIIATTQEVKFEP